MGAIRTQPADLTIACEFAQWVYGLYGCLLRMLMHNRVSNATDSLPDWSATRVPTRVREQVLEAKHISYDLPYNTRRRMGQLEHEVFQVRNS
jgi:hypothetical protein